MEPLLDKNIIAFDELGREITLVGAEIAGASPAGEIIHWRNVDFRKYYVMCGPMCAVIVISVVAVNLLALIALVEMLELFYTFTGFILALNTITLIISVCEIAAAMKVRRYISIDKISASCYQITARRPCIVSISDGIAITNYALRP